MFDWTRTLSLIALSFVFNLPIVAQAAQQQQPETGTVIGTVTDSNQSVVSGATVLLEDARSGYRGELTTNDNGFFQFKDVVADGLLSITVTAPGFQKWTSEITLQARESRIVTGIALRVEQAETSVDVRYDAEEVATEQVRIEEHQRVFGIIPNFYVVYAPNPEPLTARLKFALAWKVATDPITAIGVGVLAGAEQAGNSPDYQQGAAGFGQRFGANAADGFTDIMIGGAILPSLLHQDPRYFYQGTGTKKSRALRAIAHPFICKGDNGRWQPNYSSLGGDLASSAISNAYYPSSNRGAGLVLGNFAISTAERVVSSIFQEFVIRKLTPAPKAN